MREKQEEEEEEEGEDNRAVRSIIPNSQLHSFRVAVMAPPEWPQVAAAAPSFLPCVCVFLFVLDNKWEKVFFFNFSTTS